MFLSRAPCELHARRDAPNNLPDSSHRRYESFLEFHESVSICSNGLERIKLLSFGIPGSTVGILRILGFHDGIYDIPF